MQQHLTMLATPGHNAGAPTQLAWHPMPVFQLHTTDSPQRKDIETIIKSRFRSAHDAVVSHFLPQLISLHTGANCRSTVGLRSAQSGNCFSEHYIDLPIEQVIAADMQQAVARSEILEIGNLTSDWKGSSALMFVFLSELIVRLNFRFVLFTATAEVRRSLQRVGYVPTRVCDANPARLHDAASRWGSYYQHLPQVMYGDVTAAVQLARKHALYRGAAFLLRRQIERTVRAFESATNKSI